MDAHRTHRVRLAAHLAAIRDSRRDEYRVDGPHAAPLPPHLRQAPPCALPLSPCATGSRVSLLLLSLVSERDMLGRGRSLSCGVLNEFRERRDTSSLLSSPHCRAAMPPTAPAAGQGTLGSFLRKQPAADQAEAPRAPSPPAPRPACPLYARAPGKPACSFGLKCYRKNPSHFTELDHPDTHPLIVQAAKGEGETARGGKRPRDERQQEQPAVGRTTQREPPAIMASGEEPVAMEEEKSFEDGLASYSASLRIICCAWARGGCRAGLFAFWRVL